MRGERRKTLKLYEGGGSQPHYQNDHSVHPVQFKIVSVGFTYPFFMTKLNCIRSYGGIV